MKKLLLVLVVLLLGAGTGFATSASGTITFTGTVLAAVSQQTLTNVIPERTKDAQGNVLMSYVVYSTITGRKLAAFSTSLAASQFASRVTPALAYRP